MVPFDYLIKEKKIASVSACQLIDFHRRRLEAAEITVESVIRSTWLIKTDWKWPRKELQCCSESIISFKGFFPPSCFCSFQKPIEIISCLIAFNTYYSRVFLSQLNTDQNERIISLIFKLWPLFWHFSQVASFNSLSLSGWVSEVLMRLLMSGQILPLNLAGCSFLWQLPLLSACSIWF